jgi:hypothetical protein
MQKLIRPGLFGLAACVAAYATIALSVGCASNNCGCETASSADRYPHQSCQTGAEVCGHHKSDRQKRVQELLDGFGAGGHDGIECSVVAIEEQMNLPLAACFAEGTDPEYMKQVMQQMFEMWHPSDEEDEGEGPQYNSVDRFGSGSQGDKAHVTWSFVPDGLNIPSGIGEGSNPSELFERMDSLFGGNRARWISKIEAALNRWGELSGVTYERITFNGEDWDDGASWGSGFSQGRRGAVRICMKPIDGRGGVLAYNRFPDQGSDMVLDRAEAWNDSSNDYRFLRNVVQHEHGHGLGFAHVCPDNRTKIMEPYIFETRDGLQHDDVRGAQRQYGDQFEPNNSSSAAYDLGTLDWNVDYDFSEVPPPAVSNTSIMSIDANSEQDYYKFTVTDASLITATVTPLGLSYDDSDQAGDGSCNSGNIIDSREMGNLAIQIRDTNGSTVLGQAQDGDYGEAETVTDVLLDSPGTYFIRIYETANQTQSQLYSLTARLTREPECAENGDCDDGDPCNGAETCDWQFQCVPGLIVDCNNNGIDDACDLSSGFSNDCNGNGRPDECDIDPGDVDVISAKLSPIGTNNPQTYLIENAFKADGDVTLSFEARADLNLSTEYITISINNNSVGRVFETGARDCPPDNDPDLDTLVVPAATWNNLVNGDASILMSCPSSVNPLACSDPPSWVRVRVQYDGAPNSEDNNGDGVPDECGEQDSDGDGIPDSEDGCPFDPNKSEPGQCGCGVADTDSDGDGTADCIDGCPNDPNKIDPGVCGCGVADTDSDGDGVADCIDGCPNDPNKIDPGVCGCGVADTDSDGDGTADCIDGCPNDPNKIDPGQCGCGVADTDDDGDGVANCVDNCPDVFNPGQEDSNGDGIGDACDVPDFDLGDVNCDGVIDFDDVDAFVLALTSAEDYAIAYPNCDIRSADADCDGEITFDDIDPFVVCIVNGECDCP